MGQNATYLTDKYPGREDNLWTPCIIKFFLKYSHNLILPVSACKNTSAINGRFFDKRPFSETVKIDGKIINPERGLLSGLLPEIDNIFKSNLNSDPRRNTLAGISP
jgi:hypothetical protein